MRPVLKRNLLLGLFLPFLLRADSVTLTADITGYFYIGGFPGSPVEMGCHGNPCDAEATLDYTVPGQGPGLHTSTATAYGSVRELIGDDQNRFLGRSFDPNDVVFYGDFHSDQSGFDRSVTQSYFAPDVIGSGAFHLGPGTWQLQYSAKGLTNIANNYFDLQLPIPQYGSGASYSGTYDVPMGTTSVSWKAESEAFGAQDNFTSWYLVFTNLTPTPEPSALTLLGLPLLALVFRMRHSDSQ